MRTRTEITFEMDRVIIIDRGRNGSSWCSSCFRHVEMITIDEAAILAGVSSRAIFNWLDTAFLHSEETAEGLLRVCANSLSSIQ